MAYNLPEELLVESDGPVRIVTMNNPEHRNAFNDALHDGFVGVWAQIADDLEIPLGTVKSRMHAAVAGFARAWQAVTREKPDRAD